LIDGIGGIWGYARAYPTAPSSPAVVGAAESTASGQGELCAPGTSNRTRREKPEPRCRCSFGEVERITNLIPAPQPHSLSVAVPQLRRNTLLPLTFLADRALCTQSANSA